MEAMYSKVGVYRCVVALSSAYVLRGSLTLSYVCPYRLTDWQLGLRPRKSYSEDAAVAIRDKSNLLPAIRCYVMSGQHAEAAKLALSELEGKTES